MSQFYNTDSFHTFKEQKETDVDLKKREALEDKIFGRQKQKVTGNLDSSQVQTQMGTNTMKFCNQIQRTKAAVQEQMKQKMMQQVKGQINQIMAQKQKTVQSKDAFKSQIELGQDEKQVEKRPVSRSPMATAPTTPKRTQDTG